MEIDVYRQIDVTRLSKKATSEIRAANAWLTREQHDPRCPVRMGTGLNCIWPEAVCCSTTLTRVYNIDHRPVQRSPSDAPPAVIECPNCKGQSPTQEQMRQQMAHNGDTSGACSTCDNTHVIAVAVCRACEFEAEHGTADVPHPVHASIHTCRKLCGND
jgi:hypothetical protein